MEATHHHSASFHRRGPLSPGAHRQNRTLISRSTRLVALSVCLLIACVASSSLGCQAEVGGPAANDDDPTPDAATPLDAAPLPDANLALLCDQVYGGAPGYVACEATPTTCSFNATTGGGNCSEMCSLLGGTCVGAIDNQSEPGSECVAIPGSMDDCLTNRQTEVCICDRPDPSALSRSGTTHTTQAR